MTKKEKFLHTLLIIVTFGLIKLYWKRYRTEKKDYLSYSDNVPFNLQDLYQEIGGISNIQNCSFTYNKVRIDLNDTSTINNENILKLKGISGVVVSSKSVNLIVGNTSKAIAKAINETLTN
ncbi:hypothetical protein ACW95P_01070 [Candidatus Mycoplasma pogonae]